MLSTKRSSYSGVLNALVIALVNVLIVGPFVSRLDAQSAIPDSASFSLPPPLDASSPPPAKSSVVDLTKIEFQGNKVFSDAQIRLGIETCPEVVAKLHPKSMVYDQIQTIADSIRAGYLYAGVQAQVIPTIVQTENDLITLRCDIDEGAQYLWKGIEVRCSDDKLAKLLEEYLTSPTIPDENIYVPAFDGSEWVGRKPGPFLSEWQDPAAAVASATPPIVIGKVASCQSPWFKKAVQRSFRTAVELAGYATFETKLDIKVDHAEKGIVGVFEVTSLGVPLEIHCLEIEGLTHHTREQIQDYVNIHPGDHLTEKVILQAQRKLYESGRFQWHTVESKPLADAVSESNKRMVTIRLAENDKVPKLDEPLTDKHVALLTLCDSLNHLFDYHRELKLEYEGSFSFLDDEKYFTPAKNRKSSHLTLYVAEKSIGLKSEKAGSTDFFLSLEKDSFDFMSSTDRKHYRQSTEGISFAFNGRLSGNTPSEKTKEEDSKKLSSLSLGGNVFNSTSNTRSGIRFIASPFALFAEAERLVLERKNGYLVMRFGDEFQIALDESDNRVAALQIRTSSGIVIRGRVGTGLLTKDRIKFETTHKMEAREPIAIELAANAESILDMGHSVFDAVDGLIADTDSCRGILADFATMIPPLRSLVVDYFGERNAMFACSTNSQPEILRMLIAHKLAIQLFSDRSPHAKFFHKALLGALTRDPDYALQSDPMLLRELKRPSLNIMASIAGLGSDKATNGSDSFAAAIRIATGLATGFAMNPKDFLANELVGYDEMDTSFTRNVSRLLLALGESQHISEGLKATASDPKYAGLRSTIDEVKAESVRELLRRSANPSKVTEVKSQTAEKAFGTTLR